MKLYRYRIIDKWLNIELQRSVLTCTSPYLLNDPFDCQLPTDVSSPALSVNKYIAKEIDSTFLNDKEYGDILKEKMLSDPENCMKRYYTKVIYETTNRLRVCCFANSYENWPLWAHYAKNHSGICLEYSFPKLLKVVNKVVYKKKLPKLILSTTMENINKSQEIINKKILTKHKSWSYESEYRIVFDEDELIKTSSEGRSYFALNQISLTGIFFGYNTDTESVEYKKLIKTISRISRIPTLYCAEISKIGFGLQWRHINISEMIGKLDRV